MAEKESSKNILMGALGTMKFSGWGDEPDAILSVMVHEKDGKEGVTTATAIRTTDLKLRQFCSMLAFMMPDPSLLAPEDQEILAYVSVFLNNEKILTCKGSETQTTINAILTEVLKPEYSGKSAADILKKEDGFQEWDRLILQATFPELYPFLMAELKKDRYRGLLRPSELEKLPSMNKKYKSLWQQAHAAAGAALRRSKGLQTRKKRAEDSSAITASIENLTFPSSEELRTMFSIAHFERLPGLSGESPSNTFDSLGRLYPMSDAENQLEEITRLRNGVLAYFLSLIDSSQNDPGDDTFRFYAPQLARDLKLDPRNRMPLQSSDKKGSFYSPEVRSAPEPESYDELLRKAITELTADMESLVGRIPNDGIYRALSFQKYDTENKVFTYSSPLLFRIHDKLNPKDSRTARAVDRLIHSNAANDPPAALELTHAIFSGLLERGNSMKNKDGKVEYVTKYSTLIFNNCPQLAHDLEEIDRRSRLSPDDPDYLQYPNQYKNTILKRVFDKAAEIIFKKSDAFSYWKNLNFSFVQYSDKKRIIHAPTQSTLEKKLIVTHEGRAKSEKK